MQIEEKTQILTKFVSLSVFVCLVITAIAFYELNFQLTDNNLGYKSIKKIEALAKTIWVEMKKHTFAIVKRAFSSDNLSEENLHALWTWNLFWFNWQWIMQKTPGCSTFGPWSLIFKVHHRSQLKWKWNWPKNIQFYGILLTQTLGSFYNKRKSCFDSKLGITNKNVLMKSLK